MKEINEVKLNILSLLSDKKTENIIEIDTSKISGKLSDVCIIGSGTSSRHMQSVADYIYKYLKVEKMSPLIEGNAKSGWVMIESAGIEIHLFKPDLREYYNLEYLIKENIKPNQSELLG